MVTEYKQLSCINCGGETEEKNGKFVCKFCKSVFVEVEKISEEEVISLNRATTDRNLRRFDEAYEEYTFLLQRFPENELANWGAFLCDYGIIYEEDYDGEHIPTCHRLSERPVEKSPFYAKMNAGYKKEADKIEKLRAAILEKSKKIEPYDVFICYKATEERHGIAIPTKEATWARDIYDMLTYEMKLNVFFAEKSLQDSNMEYEPHIYAALNSAKLMFVMAASVQNVNSVWVKNEWKRYSKYIQEGQKDKTIRVVYDNIQPYDLPRELQKTQAIDHNTRGWDKAVSKAVEAIFGAKQPAVQPTPVVQPIAPVQQPAARPVAQQATPQRPAPTQPSAQTAAPQRTVEHREEGMRLLRPLLNQQTSTSAARTNTNMSADEALKMGNAYYNGKGVPQNYAEAVKYYRIAAEQGYTLGQYNLGQAYYYGRGVTQNYVEAVKWWRLAADQGYADAQNNLGYAYKHGKGVSQNPTEAVRWYKIAAEKGNAAAQYNLGLEYVSGKVVAQDYAEAAKWYRSAALKGYAPAQHEFGLMYYYGKGISQDYAEAVRWHRLAADQGNLGAQNSLGMAYEKGTGVTQNYAEAVKWYRMAADKGYALSEYNLGRAYYYGRGVTQNYAEAVKWWRKAADQGYALAQNNLGVAYKNGYGVPKNMTEALKWYRMAAAKGDETAKKNLRDLGYNA